MALGRRCGLDPAYFGLVMATGIVSPGMKLDGATRLSGILLTMAILAYLVLAVIYAGGLARYPRAVRADMHDPRRAFGFFTLTAGWTYWLCGLRETATSPRRVLLIIGGACWMLLSYGCPLLLAGQGVMRAAEADRGDLRPALAAANGAWFLWPVSPSRSRWD